MFVSFEGVDGSGKTTQAELLRARWESEGREVVLAREPGGTELGEKVRDLVLHGPGMTAPAEAALFAAARAELAQAVIRPALDRGADVICDRYVDSSLAYQGIARGLGVERVLDLNLAVIGDVLPERTFVLIVDAAQAAARLGPERDRIEREALDFHRFVDAAYGELVRMFPKRLVALDASRTPEQIAADVLAELARV